MEVEHQFSLIIVSVLLRDRDINFVGVVRKDRKGLPSFQDDKKMKRGIRNVSLYEGKPNCSEVD